MLVKQVTQPPLCNRNLKKNLFLRTVVNLAKLIREKAATGRPVYHVMSSPGHDQPINVSLLE